MPLLSIFHCLHRHRTCAILGFSVGGSVSWFVWMCWLRKKQWIRARNSRTGRIYSKFIDYIFFWCSHFSLAVCVLFFFLLLQIEHCWLLKSVSFLTVLETHAVAKGLYLFYLLNTMPQWLRYFLCLFTEIFFTFCHADPILHAAAHVFVYAK